MAGLSAVVEISGVEGEEEGREDSVADNPYHNPLLSFLILQTHLFSSL